MFLSKVTFRPDILRSSQLVKVLAGNSYGYHQLLWDLFEQSQRDFLYRTELAKQQNSPDMALEDGPLFFILSQTQPKLDSPLFSVVSKPFAPALVAGTRLAFRLRANPVVTKKGKRHDLVMDEQIAFYQRIAKELGLTPAASKGALLQQLKQAAIRPQLNDWLLSYLSQTRYFAAVRGFACESLLMLALQEAVSVRLQHWLTDNPSRQGIMSLVSYPVEDEQSDELVEASQFQWQAYQAHPIPEKGKQAQFRSVDLQGELIVHEPQQFLQLLAQGIGPAKGFGCGLMLIKPVIS
ncbi:type I-E CRISPR-associated protein Cas6/Cse3/CasE [Shewanella algae]|uniref:type I-E CRISPR-associated protein Cas6/Cse3/CasE n=1 Tax=Shewanella algae TaxID=38313 RepID=UPI0021F081BE|nr:type I-E CRISPR-associated protein Cas6/Cse3/CasE [Shewanella algae]